MRLRRSLTKGEMGMGACNLGPRINDDINQALDALFAIFDNRVQIMKLDINSYFDALAKNAQELRRDNNPLNDAEIISGKYKNDILEIIEKYFPSPSER